MKSFLKIVLLLWLPVAGMAQKAVVKITPAMFDKITDQQWLGISDGWLFKQGSDTAWAKTDIDIGTWKKLKPTELSPKYADKNGKVECWFRIKIKLDSAFGNETFDIKSSAWAALDFYINGKLVASSGNTGSNGAGFQESSPFGHLSFPANLKSGVQYTIALHFVDYLAPLPPLRLKSEDSRLIAVIRLTGPAYNSWFLLNSIKEPTIYNTVWISICTILSLLFWLLFIQNPFEKNLRFIALGSTFLTLAMFGMSSQDNPGMSYTGYLFYVCLANLFIALSCVTTPLILANIFKRKVAAGLKIFLAVFFTIWVIAVFLPNSVGNPLASGLVFILFAVCIYYMVSSWKNLKGAQWAIVVGLLFSLADGLVYGISAAFNTQNQILFYLAITAYALSFPLSLLVYVAIRFKEIIKEVQQNAQQVMQLSEEKKEEALNRQKILQEEVNRQTAEIRTALDNLKATQNQLIQSEKMASLGELTAGIAHEIQNPLNFVNNFSEVNKDLLTEMKEEMDNGNINEAKVIANDVIDNEEKINHHGKRADAIIKGMLQHSQSGTGTKEPTNINALADECMRLAYHGLRAKDKAFNADLLTRFDETLPKINVIPQDLARVMLNLFNNAFYAVNQKQKTAGADYKPEVMATTSSANGHVIISVKDNGGGIPDVIKEKIMQPFFTTKPTGEGTGLGLSLTYDMVVKGHGGGVYRSIALRGKVLSL